MKNSLLAPWCGCLGGLSLSAAVTGFCLLFVLALPGNSVSGIQATACASDSLVLESYEGYNPCPGGFTLKIDDRFDSLDTDIWERSTGGFPDNECRFIDHPDRVRFDGDGKMRLVMEAMEVPASYSRHEKKVVTAKPCASGELRTLIEQGPYGRLEARMKSPDSSGFVQSLFTFQFYKDPWQEIDIELQGRLPESVSTNVITSHAKTYQECDLYKCTNNTEKHLPIGSRHSSDWHVYTIDWLPDKINYYVDGELKRTVTSEQINSAGGNFPNQSATILMNFWQPAHKIAKWFGGEWSLDQLPLIAEYDWFRYYSFDGVE